MPSGYLVFGVYRVREKKTNSASESPELNTWHSPWHITMLIIALKKCLSKNFLLKDLAAVSLPKLVLFLYFITFHQSCLRQNRRSKIGFFPNNKGLRMVCSLVNIKIYLYFHNVNLWEKCLIYLLPRNEHQWHLLHHCWRFLTFGVKESMM